MTALLTWAWQGTAVALAALLVLRSCRRLDAATRHALWWGVLGVVLALPWLPSLAARGAAGASTGDPATAFASAPLVLPAPPDWLVAVALGAWLGTVMIGGLRVARGLRFVARVKRDARELEADRQRRLALWTSTSSPRAVTLLVSPLVRTACAVGLGRAAIVLPPSLVESVDDETLDQIVMHERAHLERYDDLWRLAETIVDAVAGLHPGVWIALAQIDLEREAACDDRVVLRTGAAERYAACLADAAAAAARPRRSGEPRLMPTAVAGRPALVARVSRLLDAGRRRRSRLMPAATLAGIVVLGAMAGASTRLAPLLAFDVAGVLERATPIVTAVAAPLPTRSFTRDAVTAAPRSGPRTALPPRAVPAGPEQVEDTTPLAGAAVASNPDAGPEPASPLLVSRTLTVVTDAPPAAVGTRPPGARVEPSSPWAAAADGGAAIGGAARRGGTAVGSGAKKAGTSIAGFFARTGRAVADNF